MAYDINKKITPYNCNVSNNRTISYIVLHWVGAVSSAVNNANYFANNKLQSSAHYFADKASIWQSVEDKDIAWHCGAQTYKHAYCRNTNSIGIEMRLESDRSISEETLKRTVWLTKKLMAQ